ncbi:MAG: hypothetical protein MR639_06810 [Clostridium sp.]|uniref:hypothetical protein n=1 Tax=Clostridium sp. TaxID=1506 RepID=UPI002A87E3D9|nr:hypothetical protein [Clostridium sp.]MDY5097452.1 hypothetical protein [Clostridium sp.]
MKKILSIVAIAALLGGTTASAAAINKSSQNDAAKVAEIRADLEKTYGKDWDDKLEAMYGDDWDKELEAKYGDDWDDIDDNHDND